MSEITDLVVPVLQRIQADLAEVKRVQLEHGQKLTEHGVKLEDIEVHLAYLTGIESQNKFDLQTLRKRIKAAEDRLSELEPQA